MTFEELGLLASASRDEVERRAEVLTAVLNLGVAPPDGDAVALPSGHERTTETVAEAARVLRDPHQWLREVVLWPEGTVAEEALALAAELLEGAATSPSEPAALVRQLAQEYITDQVRQTAPTDQAERWMAGRLLPPAEPELYLGERTTSRTRSADGEDDR
jgi:hypothetical protein